ncbi:MAG TPA: hypothetical protein VHU61_15860 [Solirubrobacteraceae bacterium]|nr:hypothetical protein [Solirubrobacteraceae bacterium]
MSMDFLEALEEQLVAATERGVRRRRWRWPWLMRIRLPLRAPTVGIAAGVGAALAASAIAATLTQLPASKPKPVARTSAGAATGAGARSFTTAGAVPAGFSPESFTAISELTWWLLGIAPCGGHSCTTIVHTIDGGPSFTRIPAPPTSQVANLRFGSLDDGYAFGQQLWSTHDGGRNWARLQLGSTVDDLDISGGRVYAIVSSRGHTQLMSSPLATDSWTRVAGLGGGHLSGLWAQGATVFVESGSHLLVSDDSGRSFRRVGGVRGAGDCAYDGGPQALWALCSTGTAPDDILLSTDSGNSFNAAAQVPDGPIDSFAAATATVAVASGQGPLYVTSDAGASWTPSSAPPADWTYLGFTDATHGVAIGQFGSDAGVSDGRLYYTTDGGASYHRVKFGP